MKFVGALIATALVGFLAFQNCQKAPNPNDISAPAGEAHPISGKFDLQTEKISEISFIFQEPETVTKKSNSYQIEVNKNLKINLLNGEMDLTSDLDSSSKKLCLTETLLNELNSILKTSQICKAAPITDGRMCTQVMKLPYAVLVTEKENFSLGSATDGCGSNAVDLCAEQKSLLQGFVASLKTRYLGFVCQ
jgi:hypothetical protein